MVSTAELLKQVRGCIRGSRHPCLAENMSQQSAAPFTWCLFLFQSLWQHQEGRTLTKTRVNNGWRYEMDSDPWTLTGRPRMFFVLVIFALPEDREPQMWLSLRGSLSRDPPIFHTQDPRPHPWQSRHSQCAWWCLSPPAGSPPWPRRWSLRTAVPCLSCTLSLSGKREVSGHMPTKGSLIHRWLTSWKRDSQRTLQGMDSRKKIIVLIKRVNPSLSADHLQMLPENYALERTGHTCVFHSNHLPIVHLDNLCSLSISSTNRWRIRLWCGLKWDSGSMQLS